MGRRRGPVPLRGRARDATLAGAVLLVVAASSVGSLIGDRMEPWGVTALGWVLIAATCGALYLTPRHPVAVGSLVLVLTFGYYVLSA
jgi:sorbitol-specific phosphotransferase system component IIBC